MRNALFVCLAIGCGSPPPPPVNEVSAEDNAREVCEAVMRRTRECGDEYVPALLAVRVRHDRPPGIAARFEEEGEDAMLEIAQEEFERDWSDRGIAAHCQALVEMPEERRSAIVERERRCQPARNCTEFVACNVDNLEQRWSEETE
jgi:hypothetical protein